MHGASRAEALKHPTWSMGSKVTVDSASLMNKALELIEAHWLFGLPASRLGAIVHPQSIVHALIEHADGNVVAHLASPDMRTPIQHALTWPARVSGCARRTDLASLGRLDFEPVDPERFPAILLADRAMRAQGTAGALLNAANEEAVGAFLRGDCSFGTITHVVGDALDRVGVSSVRSLDDVASAEREARRAARSALGLDRAV
jgi:1-deoxy-D-xylulose-5-phosphate reductoisomerase